MIKRSICLFLVCMLVVCALWGCQNELVEISQTKPIDVTSEAERMPEDTTMDENSDSFIILMEENEPLESLVKSLIAQFGIDHPDLEIELQILPGNKKQKEREITLQRLRVEVMAGKGPDIFLLPTGGYGENALFPDVNQAMHNGLFEDISEYYDADSALDKESLVTGVMDAGVLKDKRYVLPLRYDMPVAYVDVEQFESLGGNMEIFNDGILHVFDSVLSSGNKELMLGAYCSNSLVSALTWNLLGQAVDYEENAVLLNEKELVRFLESIQLARAAGTVESDNWENLTTYTSPNNLSMLFQELEFWSDSVCMYFGSMRDILDNTAYAKTQNVEIAMIPMSSVNGEIVADVTLYGAVGNGCEDVALAYEFLRTLLSEDAQLTMNSDTTSTSDYIGWPVRRSEDYSHLWNTRKGAVEKFAYTREEWTEEQISLQQELRKQILNEYTTNEIEFSILNTTVDRAEFTISLETELCIDIIYQLNDVFTSAATDVDINSMAVEFVDELKWHLAEG